MVKTLQTALTRFPTISRCYLTWDGGRSLRRYGLLPEYKANRNLPSDVSEEKRKEKEEYKGLFADQKAELQNSLGQLGVQQIELLNREADDLLGWLVLNAPGAKVIATEDRDLLQLVYSHCSVFQPTKENVVTAENFEEFTGVPQSLFVAGKALMGDKSDNIPGVPKVGETVAVRLIKRVAALWRGDNSKRLSQLLTEACEAQAQEDTRNGYRYRSVIANLETVQRNIELVSIRREVETFTVDEVTQLRAALSMPSRYNETAALGWFGNLQFSSVIKDFGNFVEPFKSLR